MFYLIPVYSGFEGSPLGFIVFFILYFGIFTLGLHYVHYQLSYAIFVAGFLGFILLLNYAIKFKQGRKTVIARKYITFLFMQLIFSIGLLHFSIDVYRKGTGYVLDSPIQPPRIHYPYNMILASLITFITVFQIIHFYYILKGIKKDEITAIIQNKTA